MFASSPSLDKSSLQRTSSLGDYLLPLLLGLFLTFICLAQAVYVVDYGALIRLFELLFVGTFLLTSPRASDHKVFTSPVARWLFVIWLGATTISVAFSPHFGRALIHYAEWLCHGLFAFTLWQYLRRDVLPFQIILLIIPLGFFLTGLFFLNIWFTLNAPESYNWFGGPPLFGHIRHFGYYALAGLIFSAYPLLGYDKRVTWPTRLLVLGLLSIAWGFIFWTGGRAAIGSGFIALVLLIWFAERKERLWTAMVATAAIGIGLWFSTLFWVEGDWMGVLSTVERTTSHDTANAVSSGRLALWQFSLDHLTGMRWLIGLGPDAYVHLPDRPFGVQPHGMIPQFLLEWGLLGTLPFLALLLLASWRGLMNMRIEQDALRKALRAVALAFIVAASTHSLVDGLYYHAQPLFFLFICFAVVLTPTTQANTPSAFPPNLNWLTSRYTLWTLFALLALVFLLNSSFLYKILMLFQAA